MSTEICYIWFQRAIGPYSRLVREILNRFESIEEVYNCEDFSFLGAKREKYIKRLETKDVTDAFEIYKRCESLGVRITGYYSDLYPKKLRSISAPPAVLYSIGEMKNFDRLPCVAMVGSRGATEKGRRITEDLACAMAREGVCIVSGLAKGVDVCAHRGAVRARGFTVAVLGTPIGEVYPKENLKAFETLYERGLVISELYPGAPRTRADFPSRNRIISGLSDAVIVTEAGEKSGALITAKHALDQDRTLYAVPGPVCDECEGSNELIKKGAIAITGPTEVLSPLRVCYPHAFKEASLRETEELKSYGNADTSVKTDVAPSEATENREKKENREKTEKPCEKKDERLSDPIIAEKILAVVTSPRVAVRPEEIMMKTGLTINEVLAELTFMEIDGLVIATPGGRFAATKFKQA